MTAALTPEFTVTMNKDNESLKLFAPELAKLLADGRALVISQNNGVVTTTLRFPSGVMQMTQRGTTYEEAMQKLLLQFDTLMDAPEGSR